MYYLTYFLVIFNLFSYLYERITKQIKSYFIIIIIILYVKKYKSIRNQINLTYNLINLTHLQPI